MSAFDLQKTKLADLYYTSRSARFDGPFEFSVHRDDPSLEKSPSYLHYPKAGEPGSDQLPALYDVVGELLDNYIVSHKPALRFEHIAAVPSGALPLAASLAQRRTNVSSLRFTKNERATGTAIFTLMNGNYKRGDRALIIDDHTSGGRNKKLIKGAAEVLGLKVTDMITVVNRQQGGVEAMAAEGVRLHALLTLEDILQHGVAAGYIDEATANKTREYVCRNQLG